MSFISSVEQYTNGPVDKDFTADELKLIDLEALQRTYMKITFKELNEDTYTFMRDVAKLQYTLPVKYLRPIADTFSYVSQKSHIVGNDKNVKNAGITIEPLNPDINNIVSYTPLNQSVPLGTVVTLDVETEFESETASRKFIWSDCLKTVADITEKIQAEKPNSIFIRPWAGKCHYCAIDIGSHVSGKYEVQYVDTSIVKSFQLYGMARCDDLKEFVIWVYHCYNLLPEDILKMISENDQSENTTKKMIKDILEKTK